MAAAYEYRLLDRSPKTFCVFLLRDIHRRGITAAHCQRYVRVFFSHEEYSYVPSPLPLHNPTQHTGTRWCDMMQPALDNTKRKLL